MKSLIHKVLLVAMFIAASDAVVKSEESLTYEQNKNAVDRYFCLYKDEGNYIHPNGACDAYVTCTAGCKTATRNSYQMCLQSIENCPAGLFFDPNFVPPYLKTHAQKDAYKARNLGGCDYKEKSECLQYQAAVCYGSRNNEHGSFTPASTGTVTKLKLHHNSGGINCQINQPDASYRGYWGGCPYANNKGKPISIWITTDRNFNSLTYNQIKDYVKFPVPSLVSNVDIYGFYKLGDAKDRDESIFYSSPGLGKDSVYFNRNKKCRVYYGQDLFDMGTVDNIGSHCISIYASFFKGHDSHV